MPAGSVMVYLGSVLHGGGQNRSNGTRLGVHIGYCLGWLRTEGNQYLSNPPAIARTYPPELQALVGYAMSDHGLGFFGGGVAAIASPEKALDVAFEAQNADLYRLYTAARDPD